MIVFAGPSLTEEDRARFPQAEWRPPAAAGDLLRLLGTPDLRIVLIDGYFDHRPAVRHKEILHLLAGGAQIWGAASIGALRAAEMAPFGMIGVGAIFRAYARGRITGDDEVALAHGPAEWRWRPLSVPLVDVRATLCRAVRAGVMGANEARWLRAAAASIHYAERTWEAVLEAAGAGELASKPLPLVGRGRGGSAGQRPARGKGAHPSSALTGHHRGGECRGRPGDGPAASIPQGEKGVGAIRSPFAPPPAFGRSPAPSPAATGRIEEITAWLPRNTVSQKRLDALACLSAAAAGATPRRPPRPVRTLFLDLLARECGVDLDRPPAPAPAGPAATPAARG